MASSSTTGRRYRILGTIGRGGFGTVYRAELLGESGFKRQVALKVLNADMESVRSVAPRLRDEARLLGMLSHRSIVKVDGLVRLNDRWTVVMEYVDGVDISRIIQHGAIPQGPALEVVGEVAGALHVAYSTSGPSGEPLRLLHRDIKPQNILVTANGEVKVLDFGVARAEFEGREAKTKAMLLGSLAYMAPERYEHDDGPGADVYAMGVLLYEMLTGDTWGRASTKPDRYQAHHKEMLGRLRGTYTALDEVVDYIGRMTEYEPTRRPSARDVERRCRELRMEVRGAWLRDWAEDVLPELIPATEDLEPHDFPSDILSESTSTAGPDLVEGGWPADKRAAPTMPPDPGRSSVTPARPRDDGPSVVTSSSGRRSASPTFVPGLSDEPLLPRRAQSTLVPGDYGASGTAPTLAPSVSTFDSELHEPAEETMPPPPPLPEDWVPPPDVTPEPLGRYREPEAVPPPPRRDGGSPVAMWLQVVGILGAPIAFAALGFVALVGLAFVMACLGVVFG